MHETRVIYYRSINVVISAHNMISSVDLVRLAVPLLCFMCFLQDKHI